MPQHPYKEYVPKSEQQSIQQSLFPAWHDRRHSPSTDTILEEGKRMRGSFQLLQGIVNEKQKQQDEQDKHEYNNDDNSLIVITKDKVKSIVKYTPTVSSILNKKLDKDTSR